jgi:putative FmdB family regulatory protein
MPIYAYRCEACGHAKDVLQKFSDALLSQCPACGAEAFKKQVTAAGFQLKGSGWYVTDFRGDSKQAKPKGDGDASETASKADTSAESATTAAANGDAGKADAGKSRPARCAEAPAVAAPAAAPAVTPAPTKAGAAPAAGKP